MEHSYSYTAIFKNFCKLALPNLDKTVIKLVNQRNVYYLINHQCISYRLHARCFIRATL